MIKIETLQSKPGKIALALHLVFDDAKLPAEAGADGARAYPVAVSTRMLIILALVCGLAILVAFAIQAAQLI